MGRFLQAGLIAGLLSTVALPLDALAAAKRALLIGINEYRANDPDQRSNAAGAWIPEDLQGAVNDISLMEQVLISRFGFKKEDIQRLENEQATRAAMLETLNAFVAATEPDDIVYIHFSGHGSQVEDQDGDEPDGLDETILSHDARTGDVPDITDDELNRILASLDSPNSLVVLDSCHSGTATRGASALRTRAVPKDPRDSLYRGTAASASPTLENAPYLLMTGAAAYQSALDGPLDAGRHYGLFSLSLGRSLGRLPAGSSAADLHAAARSEMERIGGEFGLFAVPEAQLEGDPARVNQGILGEVPRLARRAASRLAWAPMTAQGDGTFRLHHAAALAARRGSVWAIYPAGEEQFAPGQAIGILTVRNLDGEDALARAEPGLALPAEGRAIQLLDAPGDRRVAIQLDRMSAEQKAAIGSALRNAATGRAIEILDGPGFARIIVDAEAGSFTAFGADGMQKLDSFSAADIEAAADRLVALADRSMSVNELLALDNAATGMRVHATVNPVDAAGSVRGIAVVGAASAPAYRVRRADETRDRSNSLILEIETDREAYITIVNVDPEGSVATLFPNPISEQNGFYRDGLIPAGAPVRIPDGLVYNRAGFNWDFVPPAGLDTIRIFAASDLATAERIRAQVRQVGTKMAQRGGSAADPRTRLFTASPSAMASRGIQVAPSADANPSDWTATTVQLVIEE